jgi:DNA-binding transcriptional ArsR family regulator
MVRERRPFAYDHGMIQIRMRAADLGRMRFAYSPLAEVGESLYLLARGQVPPVHRWWYDQVKPKLARANVDAAMLRAVIPGTPFVPSYLFDCATSPATTIESQLDLVAAVSPDLLREKLEHVQNGEPLTPEAHALIKDGTAGPQRLAEELHRYWQVAIEPFWPQLRPVLDDDVAFRAAELTKHGVEAMLSGLHAEISMHGEELRIGVHFSAQEDLAGAGLVLVPSVFTWPHIVFVPGTRGPSTLTYGARGVGKVWGKAPDDYVTDEEALGALIGRSRAAILLSLELPYSTTELGVRLGQSPPAVSQHLAVLRRSGLVRSWRSGRSVLYRRTDLADSVIEAHRRRPQNDVASY